MDIVGRSTTDLEVVYRHRLDHGEDPRQGAVRRGWQVERVLRARLGPDGLELTVLVSQMTGSPSRSRWQPSSPGQGVVVRQRPAAYAIVIGDDAVLATEFSATTGVPGMWGLPGGGIEPGEDPAETVVREVYEESGQRLGTPVLIDVQSDHWVGQAPSGVLEDFHAVRLIYAARCHQPGPAVVHDVGGTTSAARWVPLSGWGTTPWTRGAKSLLHRHLDACITGLERNAS